MRKALNIVVPIVLCLGLGYLAGILQQESVEEWYPMLDKPSVTPPGYVIGIIWSVLYVLMGISAGLVLNSKSPDRRYLITIFGVQLLLNFLWSIMFFVFRNPALGLLDIVLLDLMVVYYILKSFRASKAAALLFIPYVLWLLCATYLNIYIAIHNL